jgi:hypothetical protein
MLSTLLLLKVGLPLSLKRQSAQIQMQQVMTSSVVNTDAMITVVLTAAGINMDDPSSVVVKLVRIVWAVSFAVIT